MAQRTRPIQLHFFVSEAEKKLIDEKQIKSGMSKGAFYRSMIIDGEVSFTDFSALRDVIQEMNKIGTNINQIARKINSTNRIYESDIHDIQERIDDIWRMLKSTL